MLDIIGKQLNDTDWSETMSFQQYNNDPIIGKLRKGTVDDPHKKIRETLPVINGKATLTEIPKKFDKVLVNPKGSTDYLFEIEDGELNENTYKVDYTEGVVFFDEMYTNYFFTFTYTGRGRHFFPASGVYVTNDEKVQTVKDKFKVTDREIDNQKSRVDTLIIQNPQPSEIVDIRVDGNGKVFRTAKDRVDDTQRKVENAYVDLNGLEFDSLKERIDHEQAKIDEAEIGANGKSYYSIRERFDSVDDEAYGLRRLVTTTKGGIPSIRNLQVGDTIRTTGYYQPGDGGDSIYSIVKDNKIPDGTFVIDLNDGLQAHLKIDRIINVKQLGAKGDGVNDDAPFIQTALNLAEKVRNIKVIIPQGEYSLTHELHIKDATEWSAHSSAIFKRNHAGPIMRNYWQGFPNGGYSGVSNFTIDGGIFDCNGANITNIATAITFAHGTNITIRNITVKDVPRGHAIELAGVKDVLIENCNFRGYRDEIGDRYYSEAIQIEPTTIANGGVYNSDDTTTKDVSVHNCIFEDSETPGFNSFPVAVGSHGAKFGAFYDGVSIKNNRIRNASYAAIRLFKFRNSTVSGNFIENCLKGIHIVTPLDGESIKDVNGVTKYPEGIDNFIVTDNIINGTKDAGILIEGQPDAFVHRAIVSNNVLNNIGAIGIRVRDIRNSIVSDNILDNLGGTGVLIDTSRHVKVMNNQILNSKENGIFVRESSFIDFLDNTIRNMGYYGFNISGTNAFLHVTRNKIYTVSQASEGRYDGILVGMEANNIYMIDNFIRTEASFVRPRYGINAQSSTNEIIDFNNDARCNPTIAEVSNKSNTSILWSGASYVGEEAVITPKKPISSCRNGWILCWSDYDPAVGANDYNFSYSYIPKEIAYLHNGKQHQFDILAGFDENNVYTAGKSLHVYDNKLVGSRMNATGKYSKDICLRYVLEY